MIPSQATKQQPLPHHQAGMTLMEIIIVLTIIGIVTAVAIPNLTRYRDNYQFDNNAAQMEYLLKYAKIYAMENSVNVGLCVQEGAAGTIGLNNLGADRTTDACDGVAISNLTMEDHVTLSTTVADGKLKFDSRGIMIQPGLGGTICVYYDNRAFKVILGPASLRTEEGSSC